jgi:hypothetical protein
MLTSVEEEETQKRGLVNILYILGNITADYNRELVERANQQKGWLPVRVNSIHICFNDSLMRTLEPIILLKLGREHRARVRMHYGTLQSQPSAPPSNVRVIISLPASLFRKAPIRSAGTV